VNSAATTIIALVRNEVFFTRNRVDEQVLGDMLDSVYLPLISTVSRRRMPRPPAPADSGSG
jgi:hypothetical protein